MIFGWPFAMTHFRSLSLQWVNTSLWKRLIRTVLGLGAVYGIDRLFVWAMYDIDDQATKFFFGFALPAYFTSFFIFGWFPIICKWLHLVLKEEDLEKLFPDLANMVASTVAINRNSSLNGPEPGSEMQSVQKGAGMKQISAVLPRIDEGNEDLLSMQRDSYDGRRKPNQNGDGDD